MTWEVDTLLNEKPNVRVVYHNAKMPHFVEPRTIGSRINPSQKQYIKPRFSIRNAETIKYL
jgi:hypothetical protein